MDDDVADYPPASVPLHTPEELDVAARRARVVLQHTYARSRQSSVYTTPFEILSLIFQECDCPLSLSHVSRLFRSVAIDTPMLWTKIWHCVGHPHYDITRTAEYLRRSQGCLLRLHLSTGHDDDAVHVYELVSALDLLIPHVHRWAEFELSGESLPGLGRCISRLSNLAAPNLRRLFIDMWGHPHENIAESVLTESMIFGLEALRLLSVKLYCIPPRYCLPPLGSVTKLHLRDVYNGNTFSSLFSTLSGLSHLTHLSLDKIDCEVWPSPRIIHLPALTSLALSVHDDENLISGILNALSASSLQSLIVDNITDTDLAKLFTRATKLSRTLVFPLVRLLTIGFCKAENGARGSGFKTNMLEQLAAVFPRVTHFTLRDIDPTRKAMSRLGSSAMLSFQHLHTITWSMVELSADEQSTVVSVLFNFLAKRYRVGLGIQVVRVTQDILDGVIDQNRMEHLEDMVEKVEVCELPADLVENWLDI